MTVLPPSESQDLEFKNNNISFYSPKSNGGSRISEYEVIFPVEMSR